MNYYTYKSKLILAEKNIENYSYISKDLLKEIKSFNPDYFTENSVSNYNNIYVLNELPPMYSRKVYCISQPSLSGINKESLDMLRLSHVISESVSDWLIKCIDLRKVTSLNTLYPDWSKVISSNDYLLNKLSTGYKYKINIIGLGDVGGMLATGLRLIGGDYFSSIGIFDKDINKVNRWNLELSQIFSPEEGYLFPSIEILHEDALFDCDIFAFCVSTGVPKIGSEKKDVRMVQLEGNSKIISYYAKLARKCNFQGIFAVISDPVDLLCKVVFKDSNTDENGKTDFKGISPENIRGYGLGVMNARAAYYASKNEKASHYLTEGRAYGPHGEGLIIADSINNYNVEISDYLTDLAKSSNMEIRATGFKPYIAPALSSAALSILATVKSSWNYSSTFIGGTFMGARNRLLSSGTEVEALDLPDTLYNKLLETYNYISKMI